MYPYEVIGKQAFKQKLITDFACGRISHAYIFQGQKGTGKKTIAMSYAKAVLCNSPVDNDACGKCSHCTILNGGGKGELYIINPEKTISIDDIRQMQKDTVLMPVHSHRKVYIIADGDRMTHQAQNCLLKTLEEPPEYCTIIITTEDADKLLETIRSRSSILHTGINTDMEVAEYLDRFSDRTSSEKSLAVSYCQGSVGKALEILESELFKNIRDISEKYVSHAINKDMEKTSRIIYNMNNDDVLLFLNIIINLFRDMAVFKADSNVRIINNDKKNIISEGAGRYNISAIIRVIFIIYETIYRLNMNASVKMALDAMNIKILEELLK